MVKAQANTLSAPLTLRVRYLWSLLTLTLVRMYHEKVTVPSTGWRSSREIALGHAITYVLYGDQSLSGQTEESKQWLSLCNLEF